MTISPPANAELREDEVCRVLPPYGGVDWLEVSLQVSWQSDEFLEGLRQAKETARDGKDCPIALCGAGQDEPWRFNVKSYGRKGHEWVLEGNSYEITIGNWMEPKSRPSLMAKVQCEYLWQEGPALAVENLLALIQTQGGKVESVKVTRADLCVDLLMREADWYPELRELRVTRGVGNAPHFQRQQFTGLTIGEGDISATLYDKALEIGQKSHKTFMFPIWGLEAVPEGHKVIRVEFCFRGEVLKQCGVKTWAAFQKDHVGLWLYATRGWLKFQDHPEAHHAERQTMPWWEIVQHGFQGVEGESPVVRVYGVSGDYRRLLHAIKSYVACYVALTYTGGQARPGKSIPLLPMLREIAKELRKAGFGDRALAELVARKVAKYQRRRLAVHGA